MIHLFEHYHIDKKQADVDFLIPFLDIDRRYCLDPSLLKFTTNRMLLSWDEEIKEFLKLVHRVMLSGNPEKLRKVLNIGEAPDAGLGYCRDGVAGSGFGNEISKQVIDMLSKNQNLKERGFIRLEELQWMDMNIGPDRISDLAINILKRHIIKYTQREAKKCGIPLEDVRVNKVFEPNYLEWISKKTQMPINPRRIVRDAVNPHPPLLFLPKEIVKPLPLFLSYDHFYGFIDPEYRPNVSIKKSKIEVVETVIKNPKLSTDFIKFREAEVDKLYRPNFDSGIQEQISILEGIPPGRKFAVKYMDTVKNIIDFVFQDDLIFYKKEGSSILREIRRDLIYQNKATSEIFSTLKSKHSATHIVIDTKNTEKITAKDVAQVSNYLNDDIGRVAFIISRKKDKRLIAHAYAQLTKHSNVIFFMADEDLKRWVTNKTKIQQITGELGGVDPLKGVANMYSDIVSG